MISVEISPHKFSNYITTSEQVLGDPAVAWSGILKSYTRFHRPKRDFL